MKKFAALLIIVALGFVGAMHAGHMTLPAVRNNGIFAAASGPIVSVPTGFFVTGVSSITASYSWAPVADSRTFTVQASTASDFTGTIFSSATAAGTSSATVSSLSPSTAYFARIKATLSGTDSAWSSNVSTTTNAAPAGAGWNSVGVLSADADKNSLDPFLSTTTATLEQAHVGICIAAVDNDGDGTDTNDFSGTMTDSAGNNWISAGENEVDPSASVAGAVVGIFYTTASFQLNTGGTIPFNLAAVKTAHAASCWEFTIPTGATVTVVGTEQKADDAASTQVSSLTVSGLTLMEHLFVRAWATENDTLESATYTSGWTAFTSTGTTGGTNTSNMVVSGEWIIASSTTSQKSFPTTTLNPFDRASDMRAFDQTGP